MLAVTMQVMSGLSDPSIMAHPALLSHHTAIQTSHTRPQMRVLFPTCPGC